MQQRNRERAPLVGLALCAVLLGAGCEVAIPLIAAETVDESEPATDDPITASSVPLEVSEASGFVVDRPVEDLGLVAPSGLDPFGGFVFVSVTGSPEVEMIDINTCQTNGFEDPYGGLPGMGGGSRGLPEGLDAGAFEGRPMPEPGFSSPCGDAELLVNACGPDGCVNPEQATIEVSETEAGMQILVEASWAGGHPMTLRLTEVR